MSREHERCALCGGGGAAPRWFAGPAELRAHCAAAHAVCPDGGCLLGGGGPAVFASASELSHHVAACHPALAGAWAPPVEVEFIGGGGGGGGWRGRRGRGGDAGASRRGGRGTLRPGAPDAAAAGAVRREVDAATASEDAARSLFSTRDPSSLSLDELRALNGSLIAAMRSHCVGAGGGGAGGGDPPAFVAMRGLLARLREGRVAAPSFVFEFVGLFGEAGARRFIPTLVSLMPDAVQRAALQRAYVDRARSMAAAAADASAATAAAAAAVQDDAATAAAGGLGTAGVNAAAAPSGALGPRPAAAAGGSGAPPGLRLAGRAETARSAAAGGVVGAATAAAAEAEAGTARDGFDLTHVLQVCAHGSVHFRVREAVCIRICAWRCAFPVCPRDEPRVHNPVCTQALHRRLPRGAAVSDAAAIHVHASLVSVLHAAGLEVLARGRGRAGGAGGGVGGAAALRLSPDDVAAVAAAAARAGDVTAPPMELLRLRWMEEAPPGASPQSRVACERMLEHVAQAPDAGAIGSAIRDAAVAGPLAGMSGRELSLLRRYCRECVYALERRLLRDDAAADFPELAGATPPPPPLFSTLGGWPGGDGGVHNRIGGGGRGAAPAPGGGGAPAPYGGRGGAPARMNEDVLASSRAFPGLVGAGGGGGSAPVPPQGAWAAAPAPAAAAASEGDVGDGGGKRRRGRKKVVLLSFG